MKKYFLHFCLCLLAFQGYAQTLAQTRCNNLQKGINLSNWLEAYWDTNWPSPNLYDKAFLTEMKKAGMKTVRLPTLFQRVTDTLPPYHVDTSSPLFAQIDSVIKWTTELDMNLIIDNQHQWNLSDTTWRAIQPRMAHLWSVLAQRYAYLDHNRYFFEIINEPSYIANDSLALFFPPIIDTIRKYDQGRTLVVSPTQWSGGVGYNQYQPLSDTNLMYAFHSYDPFPFTHQGFSWVVPPQPTGVKYPNSGYDWLIPFEWHQAMNWRDSFNLPVFLGEFGVGIHPDDTSRCNWIDTIGSYIDFYHLSALSWDVRGDFALYRSGVVSEDSIIPCFKQYLHLYDSVSSVNKSLAGAVAFDIFPNPANTTLFIKAGGILPDALMLYNLTGQVIYEGRFEHEIDVSKLSPGVYFIEIKAGSDVGRKMFVKM